MYKVAFALIQLFRFLAVPVGAWQVLGLLPVLSWSSAPGQVAAGMWFMVGIKLFILAICLLVFFGLMRIATSLRTRIKEQSAGV